MLRCRVPSLNNPYIVIRLAKDPAEKEAANMLVYRNYLNLYWPDDEEAFRRNKFLQTSARHVAVAVEAGRVIGTLSAVEDSSLGLPSDMFRPDIIRRFRSNADQLAEMTSFAIDPSIRHQTVLTLFLMKFFMQYTFYYLGIDRVIASCRPRHADFYAQRLGFQKMCDPTPHPYAGNVKCQFITLDLLESHLLLSRLYTEDELEENFYRFFCVDEHPNVRFPETMRPKRARQLDWAAIAQHRELRMAV